MRHVAALALFLELACAVSGWSAPFATLSDGGIRHTFSGFIFPKRVGLFFRKDTHQYDEKGSDVSVSYTAGVVVVATLYAYPAPKTDEPAVTEKEYAAKRREVLQTHAPATSVAEEGITLEQGGRKVEGKRGWFLFHGDFGQAPQELKSQLLVFRAGKVFVEYRFTYPQDHAAGAEREIDKFIHDWAWRGEALKDASTAEATP